MKHESREIPRRGLFETFILVAFFFSFLQEVFHFNAFVSEIGRALSVLNLFAVPLISLVLGLAVSRLHSRVAAIIFLLTLALSLYLISTNFADGMWRSIPFGLGLVSTLFDCAAAVIIVAWLGKSWKR